MNSKDWYLSSTIWGAVLAMLGPIAAPVLSKMGLVWPSDTTAITSAVVAIIGGIVAIRGRLTATTAIAGTATAAGIPPVAVNSAGTVIKSSSGFVILRLLILLGAISAGILLAGCATTPPPKTPRQSLAYLQGSLIAAQDLAMTYDNYPACTVPAVTIFCSKPEIIIQIDVTNRKARAAVTAVENVVLSPTVGLNVDTLIDAAMQAVAALTTITPTLPKGQ